MHDERNEDENLVQRWMRGRFLGMCLVPKQRDHMPIPSYSDQLLEVGVLRDEDVGSVALWNWERVETHIIRWMGW